MPRNWLSVRVELVEGRGERFWPRPGRVLVAAPHHTFSQLADAIEVAFARWDRSHLWEFRRAREVLDDEAGGATLAELEPGERFVYVYDFGDEWRHVCTVADERVDPLDELGIVPDEPLAAFGWGELPDQYGRRFEDDDGESPPPPDTDGADLPPFFYD